ncbi:MAG TPA: phosphate acetyltransferase, partial [Pseudogracilibacillus sp.]|nr:phosphate acetyltransferase [Pseudogracilibacillus sp.]
RDGSIHKETANQLLKEPNYFGTMLVYMGIADGLVSGAVYSTSDTVRPALKIIKTKKGVSKASGIFILIHNDRKYFFADCAINIAPTSKELAEIAIESAKTAKIFHVSPRIAMLSFSTKGSACSKETERVIEAVEFVQKQYPQLKIDGELQFDTAFMPTVAAKKSTNSVIKGDANIFIFPSLEAGNIGYKMIQCLGGVESVGAIIQGLNKPVNDLSRGCSIDDVYKLALITAAQAK